MSWSQRLSVFALLVLVVFALPAPALAGTSFGGDASLSADAAATCPEVSACSFVPTVAGGGRPTAAPTDGVITAWSAVGAGAAALRVVHRAAGGTFAFLGTGPVAMLSDARGAQLVRLPVQAGDLIGLSLEAGAILRTAGPAQAGAAAYAAFPSAPYPGLAIAPAASGTGALLLEALLEPDTDRDGYGDLSQDGCPGDALTHGACGAPGTGSVTVPVPDRSPPILSGLRLAVDTLRFNASEAGTLLVWISRLADGRRVHGRCVRETRRNRRARRCTRHLEGRGLDVAVVRGPGAAVIGRRTLRAGRYAVTVRLRDAAGNTGTPTTVRTTVRR